MFGLTFLSPMFLFGLLAAPLPILIHLFQRRRAKLISWSSLEFVHPLQHPRKRRVDPRRLLLLAVRVLALVLLALALARPTFSPDAAAAGRPVDAVIVLDASLSMGSRAGGGERGGGTVSGGTGGARGTTLANATRLARAIVDGLRKGDRAALIVAGDPATGEAPGTELSEDFTAVRARLDEVRASAGRLSWSEALGAAASTFSATGGAGAGTPLVSRELFLVSDFQASGWEDDVTGAVRALGESGVRVIPVGAGSPPQTNLSADDIDVGETSDGRVQVKALVRNHGRETADRIGVELVVADRPAAAGLVSVDAGEAEWAVVDAPGDDLAYGRVNLPEDALSADNTRWFARAPDSAFRVLLVGRPSPSSPGHLTTQFLRQALQPSEPRARDGFTVEETAAEDLGSDAIESAQVIVLADTGPLSDSAVDAVKRTVRAGAGLFILLGPGTDAGFMNRVFFADFLPLEVEPMPGSTGAAPFGWGTSDAHHPVFSVFSEGPREAFQRAAFMSCMEARVSAASRVIAAFANGRPALIEAKSGSGRVFLFTSAPDLAWSNFPLSGNFVPFVHEALRYLAGGEAGARSTDVHPGELARRMLDAPAGGGGLLLRTPDGGTTPLVAELRGRRSSVIAGPLTRPGVYAILRDGAIVDRFAVNPDPRESDAAPLSAGELVSRLAPLEVDERHEVAAPGPGAFQSRYGREIARGLLWAVFALLIAELLIRGSFTWRKESPA